MSIVKETESRAVRYSVLEETCLILTLVLRYSEYLLQMHCQELRFKTTVKGVASAAWVRAFVSFGHFFRSGTSTAAMIHKSATALL